MNYDPASARPVGQRHCVISAGKTNCPWCERSMGAFVMASIAGDEPIRDLADRTVRATLGNVENLRVCLHRGDATLDDVVWARPGSLVRPDADGLHLRRVEKARARADQAV